MVVRGPWFACEVVVDVGDSFSGAGRSTEGMGCRGRYFSGLGRQLRVYRAEDRLGGLIARGGGRDRGVGDRGVGRVVVRKVV